MTREPGRAPCRARTFSGRCGAFVLVAAGLLGVNAAGAGEPSEQSWDGLVRVPGAPAALVYARPDVDLSRYRRVLLAPVYVAFAPDWQREHRELSANDLERGKRKLAQRFQEVFTEVLEEGGGYPVVFESGADVLGIRAALIDLEVTAPDVRPGRSRSFGYSAGRMTLVLELVDSVSGAILARAVDRREGRRGGMAVELSSVENWAQARKVLADWATLLRRRLEEFHGPAAAGAPAP